MIKIFDKLHIGRTVDQREISAAPLLDKWSTYPSSGLTPVRLARIFRAADEGDVLQQMELYEEMEEKDPHLFAQLQTRKNAVTGLDWEVLPFSDEDRDKEIADFISTQLQQIEGMEDVLFDLLDAIGKGIAISEIMWGQDGNRTVVRDIRRRHQKRLIWDQEDQLRIATTEQPAGMLIPANKFVIHRYKARSGHPSRAGVLRVCAWMYLFKNYDVKDWIAFCEVFGMPLRLGKYSASASEEDKHALFKALIKIGTDAAGIIPDTTMIEFIESMKATSVDVYERLARYCDEQVSKAILGQTLTSDSGGGSYAQSKTHNEVRHDLTVADCKALAATLRRDLIRPLVLFNFGEDRRVPSIRFDCEEAGDQKENAEVLKTLVNDIGLPVSKAHLYKKFSIPKPDEGDELVEPPSLRPPTVGMPGMPGMPLKLKTDGDDDLEEAKAVVVKQQRRIDAMVDDIVDRSDPVFEKMFAPLKKMIDQADSLEEVKEKLTDPEYLTAVCKQIDGAELDAYLQRMMMIADLRGRQLEAER